MPLDQGYRYNSNTFAIAPKTNLVLLKQESGAVALPQDNYKVYNVGRTAVYVELIFGTKQGWEGFIEAKIVKPGETEIFDNKGKPYHTTALKIYNQLDIRAIVHASKADGSFSVVVLKEPGLFDFEYNRKLKELFSVGVKYTPYVSEKFHGLLNTFWPSNKPHVWQQIQVKLQPFLGQHTLNTLSWFLNNVVHDLGERIKTLSSDFEKGQHPVKLYMLIAQHLVGFEANLIFGDDVPNYKTINKFLLPIYSTSVLMKVIFYTLGIICREDIGLSASNVTDIKNYLDNTVKHKSGATAYVTNMYNDWVQMIYDSASPEDIYNNMMNARTLIAIHGIEYSRIWDNILRNPLGNMFTPGEKVYNDVISYSTFFGRQTANLNKEALTEQMQPPLTPLFVGFKRNYIRSVEVYIWRRKIAPSSPKIGGLRVVFENDNTHTMGTISDEIKKIDFNGSRMVKLKVTGAGAVDSCVFFMSDGREFSFGTKKEHTLEETFELKDHHIVSLFLSSDNVTLGGQAANIAVSYRLNDDYE